MKKEYWYIIIIIILIGIGIYLYLNKEVIIKYPAVSKIDTKIEQKIVVLELPKQSVNISDEYFDIDSNYHQRYEHKLVGSFDSVHFRGDLLTDVNVKQKVESIELKNVQIKYPEKIVTKTIVDTLIINKIIESPFYSDNWFWYSITVTALFFGSLFAIIFG